MRALGGLRTLVPALSVLLALAAAGCAPPPEKPVTLR